MLTRMPRAAVLLCVLLLAAACGSDPSKEKAMTPDQANSELRSMAKQVLADLDGSADVGEAGKPSPCGGVEGPSMTKIKYGLTVDTAAATDPEQALDRAAKKLEDLGYQVSGPDAFGEDQVLKFTGKAANGRLIQRQSGEFTFGAETPCLDNPDK